MSGRPSTRMDSAIGTEADGTASVSGRSHSGLPSTEGALPPVPHAQPVCLSSTGLPSPIHPSLALSADVARYLRVPSARRTGGLDMMAGALLSTLWASMR